MGKLDSLPEGSLDDINWPRGIQQLTDKGKEQCKIKGEKFSLKIINSYKLFKNKIDPDKVQIISTNKNRVQESA